VFQISSNITLETAINLKEVQQKAKRNPVLRTLQYEDVWREVRGEAPRILNKSNR
jgi:hypothetical protein